MARYGSGSVPIGIGWKCTNCHRTHRSSIPRSASGNTRARRELTTGTSQPPRNWSAPCPESSGRCKSILNRSDPICFLFADRNVPLIMRGCIARAIALRKRTYQTLLLLAALAAGVVVFGEGGRSPGVIIMIITLVFADLANGPIPLKLVAPVILAGLLGFMMLGYYRNVRDLGLGEAVRVAYQRFDETPESDNAYEFTVVPQ